MNTYNAGTLVETTIASYTASLSSVHEQLSRIDFISRLTFSLAAPGALLRPEFQISIPCNPGPAVIREALGKIKDQAGNNIFGTIAQVGYDILTTPLPSRDPVLQSVINLRNHVFHGGALPPNEFADLAAALVTAVNTAINNLVQTLSQGQLEATSPTGNLSLTALQLGGHKYDLSPLLAISATSNTLLVFSRVTSKSVTLNAPRHEAKYEIPRTNYESRLKRIFRMQHPNDSLMSDFTQAVLEDLEGFKEQGSSIDFIENADSIDFRWVHGDRDPVQRLDRLRVGPDNAWQWFDGNENKWKGYTQLLRNLVNWPVLTRRLAYMLKQQSADAADNESVFLPLPAGVTPKFIPPTISVGPIGTKGDDYTLDKFIKRLDEDVKTNRGTTYLYFVHAEAGAGKTTALLHTASERIENICADVDTSQAIFLYVSARGNVLENLDQAVAATVNATHLLTSDSVRALCRNGLIIPIVDGFDELVGSPTYADALASLRPWLEGLGGRGVLIVSARSNYFVRLYEESISRPTNQDINVTHLIAELGRWMPEQLKDYFKSCRIGTEKLNLLAPAELVLLQRPFFARASISHLLAGNINSHEKLVPRLMRDYVEREQMKLQGPSGEHLVTAEDLEKLFEELAAIMMENNTREVSLEELTFVAEYSFDELLPEMKNRLAAICGLDVSAGRDRRFRFSHEILLDFFFGRHIGKRLRAKNIPDLHRILKRSQLTTGASQAATDVCVPEPAILTALMKYDASGRSAVPLTANIGLLWREFFNVTPTIGAVEVTGVEFPPMELQNRGADYVKFISCQFHSLAVRNLEYMTIFFDHCGFKVIRVIGSGRHVTLNNCSVDVAWTPTTYTEDSEEINRALRDTEATVNSPDRGNKIEQSVIERYAETSLEKIINNASLNIIVGANNLPPSDGYRISWIINNRAAWLELLRELQTHGLASLETIRASGPTKWRVRWTVLPREILARDGSIPSVEKFWASLAQNDYS